MDITLHDGAVTAVVSTHGAMVTLAVTLPDGHVVEPLFRPAWSPDYDGDPLLGRVRGDFLCVPFGAEPDSAALPERWRRLTAGPTAWPHGYAASHEWHPVKHDTATLVLELNYPEEDDVAQVRREVTLTAVGIHIVDTVQARRVTRQPVGLHPILRLPSTAGAARLEVSVCRSARTQPIPPEPTSRLAADAVFDCLSAAPLAAGGTEDVTRLPLQGDREEIILLDSPEEPRATLVNEEEGYMVTLRWDDSSLASLMLWMSNRGRPFAPWDGRNVCLGVEPVSAAFDYGSSISASDNPLVEDGIPTTIVLSPEVPVVLTHTIEVAPLD